MELLSDDYFLLRLLKMSPFERRATKSHPAGVWRFGTKVISDQKVARLVASGRAQASALQVTLVTPASAEAS